MRKVRDSERVICGQVLGGKGLQVRGQLARKMGARWEVGGAEPWRGGLEPLQERRLVEQGTLPLHGDFSFFLEPYEVTIVSLFH